MRTVWAVVAMVAMTSAVTAQDRPEKLDAALNLWAKDVAPYAVGMGYQFTGGAPEVRQSGNVHRWSRTPLAEDTLWHIGSITKSFTATLIMQLEAEGLVALDAPIATYLAAFEDQLDPSWGALTLDALLTHNAGVPPNAAMRLSSDNPRAQRLEVLQSFWTEPLNPPEEREYSNLGYVLAGVIAEEVTGQDWRSLVQTRIAEPLGLQSLGFGAPMQDGAPYGHRRWLGVNFPVEPGDDSSDNPAWMGPAGRLHMSIADLLKWGTAHNAACAGLDETLLPQASCQQMRASVQETFGYGWVTQFSEPLNQRVVWHNGSNTMWYAILIMVPEAGFAVAAAINRADYERTDQAAADLAARLLDIELEY
ncbi:MAG: serine hydrolase domain-containing protein [Pseudomonadota bacterium]